jgi:hypothetical protein
MNNMTKAVQATKITGAKLEPPEEKVGSIEDCLRFFPLPTNFTFTVSVMCQCSDVPRIMDQ